MKKLAKYADTPQKVRELAHRLDVAEASVYRWMRGDCRPHPKTRDLIEQKTSGAVKAKDW